MQLIDCLNQNKQIQDFIKQLAPQTQQMLTGLTGSAKTLFLVNLINKRQQPLLVVEPDSYHASQLADDLGQLLPSNQVQLFLLEASIATQIAISSPESLSQRLSALDFLREQKPGVVITSIAGLEYVLPPMETFTNSHLHFKVGQEMQLEQLPDQLISMGYRRDSLVSSPGEFAIRGDIFDIYPLTRDQPLRIEFFGDEIDAIHEFDSETQRSQATIDEITLSPASDQIVSSERLHLVGQQVQQALAEHIKKVKDQQIIKNLQENYQADLDSLLVGQRVDIVGA